MVAFNLKRSCNLSWEIEKRKLTEKISVAIINIHSMNDELASKIDELILSVCHGKNSIGNNLQEIKDSLYKNIINDGKIESNIKMGAVAEFFVHIYLNSIEYKQECFFLNLEEPRGIKKGFDGFYSLNDIEWIMESKSGSSTTKDISHKGKIKEAYDDLKKKFSSNTDDNDPWKNAIMHAGHYDISSSQSLISRLIECAQKFKAGLPVDISRYNIIPTSTIFIRSENYELQDIDKIVSDIENMVKKFSYNQVLAVCVTQHSLDIFAQYLKK